VPAFADLNATGPPVRRRSLREAWSLERIPNGMRLTLPAIFLSRVLASALLGCGLAYYSLFSGRVSGNPNSVFVAEVCLLLGL